MLSCKFMIFIAASVSGCEGKVFTVSHSRRRSDKVAGVVTDSFLCQPFQRVSDLSSVAFSGGSLPFY